MRVHKHDEGQPCNQGCYDIDGDPFTRRIVILLAAAFLTAFLLGACDPLWASMPWAVAP